MLLLAFAAGALGCETDERTPDAARPAPDATPDPIDAGPDVAPDGGGCEVGESRPCRLDEPEGCAGVQTCLEGVFGTCRVAPERCNDADDDCDGRVDEPFPEVGDPCTVGIGACRAAGVAICGPDGGTTCNAVAGTPRPETCDGLDEDCDGATDEDVASAPCAVGTGACAAEGRTRCADGAPVCDATPGPAADEVCNGLDDDCDGVSDEAPVEVGRPCSTDRPGVCDAGRLACAAGGLVCEGEVEPSAEMCDGLDDDCDGAVDEDFGVGEGCVVGVGACAAAGVLRCADDGAACDAAPGVGGDEVCNRVDDDCDGATDEGLGEPEVCNGLDDDCDGAVDEGFGVGEGCVEGVGACAVEGRLRCADDGAAACDAVAGDPRGELCNGLDDDCDGAEDEGLGVGAPCEEGVGACAAVGVGVCGDGGALVCFAEPGAPGPERCDGVDDDCDGAADEDFRVGESCAAGVGACRREGVRRCAPGGADAACDAVAGAAADEVCNDADDDCDGATDEGFPLGAPCEVGRGECRARGGFVCAEGGGLACDAVAGEPVDERCDGLDQDCDGRVDEGLGLGAACPVGRGACERVGVRVCGEGGAVACEGEPGMPSDEVCNGIDDDCDGSNDEGFAVGSLCGAGLGACRRAGRVVCDGDGGARCDADVGAPAPEVCNGADDDCDGVLDEVLDCAPYVSCDAALAAGRVESGTYVIGEGNTRGSVWCDQTGDGGGWTLVSASRGAPPADEIGAWNVDLQAPAPAAAHGGVWSGLRRLTLRHDLRFVCFAGGGGEPTVDLSFYDVPWYREITTGGDRDSCFSEADGLGRGVPAIRRDNLGGQVRARGQGRDHPEGDWFEGEDACDSPDDFAIDFDDRALGGVADPSDWGLFDGVPRCGTAPVGPDTVWLIYARRPKPAPLGTVAVVGAEDLAYALADSGFAVEVLPVDPLPDLAGYTVVFFGQLAPGWIGADALGAALDARTRAGGAVVAEFDGAALLGRGYAADFVFADGAPAPWGWLPMTVGGGEPVGLLGFDPVPQALSDPALRSLPAHITGRLGPAAFVRPNFQQGPPIEVLTTSTSQAHGQQVSAFRAVRCGAHVLAATGSLADAAREADIAQLIRNFAGAAASPPPADVRDSCPD